MTTYIQRKVPGRVVIFHNEDPEEKDSDVMLLFTPDAEASYPLGIGIEALHVLVTVSLDQLIEKVKNDIKEGKL